MALQYKTYSTGTLGSNYTVADTTITLTAGNGANFPTTGDFYLRLNNTDGTIRKVTARSTDTLTLAAGTVDGTTDQNATSGTQVDAVIAASALNELRADISQEGTYSSRPTGGQIGDIYRTTDSAYVMRWNGSSLDAFGPVYPATPLLDSTYTTYVTGGSPVKVDTGAVSVTGVNGDSIYRGKSLGVTIPYTSIDLGFNYNCYVANNASAGLFLRDSSGGKIIGYQAITSTSPANGTFLQVVQLNNDGSFHAAAQTSAEQVIPAAGTLYLRIVDNGTNRTYWYGQSPNGPWLTWFSEASGTWVTGNQDGYFINGNGTSVSALFFHFKETQ